MVPRTSALALLLALGAPVEVALAHPAIERAIARIEAGDSRGAIEAFWEAEASDDLTSDELAVLLERRAAVHGALGDERAAARDLACLAAFRPSHVFGPWASASLRDAFERARGARLVLEIDVAWRAGSFALGRRIEGDPGGLVRAVRLFVRRSPDEAWALFDGERVEADSLELYAEGVGPGGAVVAERGSAASPLRAETRPLGEESGPRVEYVATAGCPEVGALRDAVLMRTEHEGHARVATSSTLRVRITSEGAMLRGEAEIVPASGSAHGHRTLEVPSGACADLVDALALHLALASVAPATPRPVDRPRESTPHEPSTAFALSLQFTAGAGLLPGLSLGGVAVAGARIDRVLVGGEVRALFSVAGRSPLNERALEAGIVTLGPTACVHDGILVLCGSARFGPVWGRSPAAAQPRTAVGFFASFAAFGGLALEVGDGWALDAALEVEAPLTRISLDGSGGALFVSSWLAGALRLGASAVW
jgi:hypothetical protein